MRNKKWLAILLAVTMVLSMHANVFAGTSANTDRSGQETQASQSQTSGEDSTYTSTAVESGKVAAIGDTQYDSLAEAIGASQEGDTIKLLADIDNSVDKEGYTGGLDYTLKARTTLNGEEHTISGHVSIHVSAEGGTVQNIKFKNIHNNESKLSAVYASDLTGTLNIKECEFDTCDWDAIQTTPKAGSVVDIQGNVFRNTGEKGINTQRYVHVESAAKTDFTATITHNKFYDNSKLQETALEVYYPTEKEKVKLSHNYIDEPMSSCIIMNSYSTLNSKPELALPFMDETLTNEIMPEAGIKSSVNYYYYPGLADAVAAVQNNGSIKLLSDAANAVTIAEGKNITLNLNGDKKIGNITNNGTLTLTSGTTGNNTTTNGAITNNGHLNITSGGVYNLEDISGNGTVTISGGSFTTKPNSDMLSEWHSAKEDDNGNYIVSLMTYEEALEAGMVASGNDNKSPYYKTITEAVNKSGQYKAYLQKDSNESVSFNTNTYRSLYLNNHTFTGSINMGGLNYVSLFGSSANLANVIGKQLNVGSDSTSADITIHNANLETLDVKALGYCKVEGGKYGKITVRTYYEKKDAEQATATGRLVVTGGTFSSDMVTVTANHKEKSTTAPLSDYVPKGYQVIDNEDGTYTVQAIKIVHVHNAIKVEAKAPTYTSAGNIEHWYCADCGKYFKDASLIQEIKKEDTVIPKRVWISADYSKVDAAIEKANALTSGNYKDFSAVEAAIAAVVRDKNSSAQAEVDAMAKAIEDAIAALTYKDADYSKVDAALAKAAALNKDDYKDFSAVKAAIAAVVRDKNITQQAEVDAMAKAIEDAIGALEAAPAPAPAETVTKEDIAAGTMALNKKIKAAWNSSNLAVTWGKVSKADGYEVYAAKCGDKYTKVKTVKGNKTLKYTVKKIKGKKLDPKRSYKVCVKAYRLIDGKKNYTGTSYGIHTVGPKNKTYTNAKSVKASKKSVTLKKGKNQKVSVTITKQTGKKKLLKSSHVANLRYFSTNAKVATVTKGGTIKAAGKGSCTVYALAANGVKTTVKVTVK